MNIKLVLKFGFALALTACTFNSWAADSGIVPNDSVPAPTITAPSGRMAVAPLTEPREAKAAVQPAAQPEATAAKTGAMPFDLIADNISYDVSGSMVTARGEGIAQVHVKSAKGDVWADKINYDLAANQVVALGNVKFVNLDSTTIIVDKLELSGDMQRGALEQMHLRLPLLGEIARAGTATISGSTYTMTDVVYSPCTECIGNQKPWSFNADKMVYDQDKGTMTYNKAVMDVYGVPVMYLPWFKHPVGPKNPQDGLLPPVFGSSQRLGDNIMISGYVFNPAENADYTIRDRLMSERGNQLMVERRQTTLTTDSDIKASYLNDTKTSSLRSNLAVEAEKDFDSTRRIGLTGEVASDDTYLSQYFDRLDPYLASTLYGEDGGDQHYVGLSMTHFQDLDPTRKASDTAQVYPHLELERWFVPSFGGQAELTGDMVNIYRGNGTQSRRMVGQADYTRPFMLEDGSKVTLGAKARLDFYVVDNGPSNGAVTRALPEATALWEKPYISPGGNHTIAPQVLLAMSPRGGNSADKIPNEDSESYELDTTNLFEPSRFAGLDRVETGPRVVYGLDNRWGSPDRTDWRVFVGQSVRKNDDASLPQNGGFSSTTSDWVGLLEANPTDWLSFSNRFRLDNATFTARRLDSSMQLGYSDGAYVRVSHSYLDNGPQELSSEFNIPLRDDLKLRGKTRDDLATSTLLESQAGLVWAHDCYELEGSIRRRGYTNGDLQPGTDYIVNLKLLTLGNED